MKYSFLSPLFLLASSGGAYAGSGPVIVPEIGTTGSIAAVMAVTGVAALIWERRRKK